MMLDELRLRAAAVAHHLQIRTGTPAASGELKVAPSQALVDEESGSLEVPSVPARQFRAISADPAGRSAK
jgi:hypothetical protein